MRIISHHNHHYIHALCGKCQDFALFVLEPDVEVIRFSAKLPEFGTSDFDISDGGDLSGFSGL
jgi:hypothetical protein